MAVTGLLASAAEPKHAFVIGEKDFLLDGKRFVIRSGELHYARIPREYWPHRLRMAKALGLNTASTYVFWNLHEPQPGQFDFTGNADVAEFCRAAEREGLYVIVRPGPYVCGEWDMGGLPWWLLKDPQVRLRTQHPGFLEPARRYLAALGRELAPLQITRRGPILMVQVENEYLGYGRDWRYLEALRDALRGAGFEVPLFTCDMAWSLRRLPETGLFQTLNFGQDPQRDLAGLRAFQPTGPLMCAEYYTGWFDRWGVVRGGPTLTTNVWAGVASMLDQGVSFNLYMAHGGTSFGFWAGANIPPLGPTMTSYDYGAPISEAGWDTPRFHGLREVFARHLPAGQSLPPIPPRNPVISIAPFALSEKAALLADLPRPKHELRPQPMEAYDQPHGCVLYRTTLPPGGNERLVVDDVHDYALVLLDGERIGTLDRRRKRHWIRLPARDSVSVLDLLVEAAGRINYGQALHDRKGITEKVTLMQGTSVTELTGWEVYNLPLDAKHLASLKFGEGGTNGPAFYRGRFRLDAVGDTFLDLRSWGRGAVWVNGHNLGRYWSIGPQQTLYCPGPWLKAGQNEAIVWALEPPQRAQLAGLPKPILGQLNQQGTGLLHRRPSQTLRLTGITPVAVRTFPSGPAAQTVSFAPVQARYVCLEAMSSQTNEPYTTMAELAVLGPDGVEADRSTCQIVYADSEEVLAEDGAADNLLDEMSDTFWHTEWGVAKPSHPHQVVIDLGSEQTVSGVRYLPRQDSANGRIKQCRLYVSPDPFPGLTP